MAGFQMEEFQKLLKARPILFFYQVLQKPLSLENQEDLDQELGDIVRNSPHFKEGVAAFLDKRTPNYK